MTLIRNRFEAARLLIAAGCTLLTVLSAYARAPQPGACTVCRTGQWTLSDGFVFFPTQDSAGSYVIGGPVLPSVALICSHCGNTIFINLLVLGLGHLVNVIPRPAGTTP